MRKLFLLLLLMAGIMACSSSSKPDKTVAVFFQNLKQANYEKAQDYISAPIFNDMPDVEKELLGIYFGTMKTANIKVAEQAKLAAAVNIDITAVDLSAIVQNFIMNMADKLANEGLSMENVTDEQLDAMLLQELQSPDAPVKSMTVTLTLNKVKGKWLIEAGNTLHAALFLQEYSPGYNDESYYDMDVNDDGYSIVDTVNTGAVFIKADEMTGICEFKIGGAPYQMYCEPEQMEDLTENYTNEDVEIIYQVLQSNLMEGSAEERVTLYILDSIVR